MVNLNNLPCELGNPGDRPIPVDPIDGGSVDEPEDDGDDTTQPPIHPVPTVWACIPVSPGIDIGGRICKQYKITELPPNVIGTYADKDECEKDCTRKIVCRRNRITGQWECLLVKLKEVLPGETTYTDWFSCYTMCGDDVPPGGGGEDGPGPSTGVPGGPGTPTGPASPGPGTTTPGPSTGNPGTPCPPKVYHFCVKRTGPTTQAPVPCVNVGINRPNCLCTLKEDRVCVAITVRGTRDAFGNCIYPPVTPPINTISSFGSGPNAGISCANSCRPIYDIDCPDGPTTGSPTGPATPGPGTGPGPQTPGGPGGPVTGRPFGPVTQGPGPQTGPTQGPGPQTGGPRQNVKIITYYYCKETIIGCKNTANGWIDWPTSLTSCRCKKRVCTPYVIRYTTPYPPPPGPNRGRSCSDLSNCPSGTGLITPIPNTCVETPDISDPSLYNPPGTTDPDIPNTNDGPDTNDGGVIVTPTDGIPTTPIILPENQDNESLPEYQFDPNEIDNYTEAGYSFIDNTYAVTTDESNTTVAVKSNLNSELFNLSVDFRLQILATNAQAILSDLNAAMSQLSFTNIKDSLNPEIADILFNLTYPDGRPIPQHRIIKAIKKHLLEGTVDSIDTAYIRSLKQRALLGEESTNRILELPTTQFGRNKSEIIAERQQAKDLAGTLASQVDTTPNETRGVVRALTNAKSLDPNNYLDQTKDLLKLWYILPTDINRRILISASGTNYPVYIKDTDTISVTTSAGSAVSLPVDRLQYTVSVLTSTYGFDNVASYSDIDRAYILNNIVEQATLHDVGSKWQTVMTITSPSADNLELTYSLTDARPRYYVLKINRESITEIPDSDSIFTRKTQVNYTLETAASAIREAVKFRVYPWKVFTVNHNDPILGHIGAESTYKFEFTNFSLNQFGTDSGEQLFVRRIPEIIILLPTDKFNLNFFNGYSQLNDWNQRTITFSQSPDTRYTHTGLDQHWVKIEETYPATNIDGDVDVFGRKGTFTGRAGILSLGYTSGTEPLPRREYGFRSAALTASSIYLNYKVDTGLLWSDLFIRMTADQYKTYKIGIPTIMIEKLRLGQKTGVKLIHNRNDNFIKDTRVLNLRTTTSEEVPIKINKYVNERIQNAERLQS